MIESKKYTNEFFAEMERNSFESAKVVLPLVNELIRPQSIIDVGCGTAMWLKVWDEVLRVKDYLGIEGPYLKPELIKVPLEKIKFQDLKTSFVQNRKFDLAMSLEVAEHLPETSAHQFVGNLTSLSDVILFSAAIPHQEGTYHINEQYPEYWAKHFRQFDYVPVDCLRPLIWNNPKVQYWYQQNVLIFMRSGFIKNFPELEDIAAHTNPDFLTRIHPYLYELKYRQMSKTSTFLGLLKWKWGVLKYKLK